jgi:hypothetical protein
MVCIWGNLVVINCDKQRLMTVSLQGILGISFDPLLALRRVIELLQETTHREIEQGSCGNLVFPIEDLDLCK